MYKQYKNPLTRFVKKTSQRIFYINKLKNMTVSKFLIVYI